MRAPFPREIVVIERSLKMNHVNGAESQRHVRSKRTLARRFGQSEGPARGVLLQVAYRGTMAHCGEFWYGGLAERLSNCVHASAAFGIPDVADTARAGCIFAG